MYNTHKPAVPELVPATFICTAAAVVVGYAVNTITVLHPEAVVAIAIAVVLAGLGLLAAGMAMKRRNAANERSLQQGLTRIYRLAASVDDADYTSRIAKATSGIVAMLD